MNNETATKSKRILHTYGSRIESIPEKWLTERSESLQEEGLTSTAAYTQAVIDWFKRSEEAGE